MDTAFVTPVVENTLEHVDTSTTGHGLEKISTHHLTTVQKTSGGEVGGFLNHPWTVIQYPPDGRKCLQHLREKTALASTDIYDPVILSKVIATDDGGVLRRGKVCESAVEPNARLRMLSQVIKEAHAMHGSKTWF